MRKIRCAVYTRKSTAEELEAEFNSLDAQREACEAYIASQRPEGWVLVPDRYDDGGVSGGTLERPALQRLMRDVEHVVVHLRTDGKTLAVHVPMQFRKRSGRKVVIALSGSAAAPQP